PPIVETSFHSARANSRLPDSRFFAATHPMRHRDDGKVKRVALYRREERVVRRRMTCRGGASRSRGLWLWTARRCGGKGKDVGSEIRGARRGSRGDGVRSAAAIGVCPQGFLDQAVQELRRKVRAVRPGERLIDPE